MRKVDDFDQELFAKLDKIDAMDSSDENDDEPSKNASKKIVFKVGVEFIIY